MCIIDLKSGHIKDTNLTKRSSICYYSKLVFASFFFFKLKEMFFYSMLCPWLLIISFLYPQMTGAAVISFSRALELNTYSFKKSSTQDLLPSGEANSCLHAGGNVFFVALLAWR
jgi:hypothetical protein